jgi:hypothetical protein
MKDGTVILSLFSLQPYAAGNDIRINYPWDFAV